MPHELYSYTSNSNLTLFERNVGRCVKEGLTTAEELHHQPQFVLHHEGGIVRHNVGMVALAHSLDLFLHSEKKNGIMGLSKISSLKLDTHSIKQNSKCGLNEINLSCH